VSEGIAFAKTTCALIQFPTVTPPISLPPGSDHSRTIACQQGARSFELRAALGLAKLYQSIGRSVEARTILAPALEGFPPTPEMPEFAEAQALLGELSNPPVG
jgi:hypothetical protein